VRSGDENSINLRLFLKSSASEEQEFEFEFFSHIFGGYPS
jgi:hypothetical protein